MKQWVRAVTGLSGVVGDGAWGQIRRGTWEARRSARRQPCNALKEFITSERLRPGVGPAHNRSETGNDRGAKGPEQRYAVRGVESRLDENPATGEPQVGARLPETGPEPNLPEKLSTETEAGPKSQAGAEVPLLCAVRPDLSAGHAGSGLGAGASQTKAHRAWTAVMDSTSAGSPPAARDTIAPYPLDPAARTDVPAAEKDAIEGVLLRRHWPDSLRHAPAVGARALGDFALQLRPGEIPASGVFPISA